MKVRLGLVQDFGELPTPIVIDARTYFLTHDGAVYHLLSNVCPHQGGSVRNEANELVCPLHGWRFDRGTGRCLNAPSRSLSAMPVHVDDGVLFAEVPATSRVDRVHAAGEKSIGLSVHLHAHACLEISYEGFTLLTDPWLDGPAFLGSWAPYPAPLVRGADLRPDAILITHEHSDHFHEPTLRAFDRRPRIYVPDFPNQRLQHRLAALGFVDIRTIRFGDPCALHEGWRVTAFEPQSYWNDAFFLIEVAGQRIFNANDAGVNARIGHMVAPVDVLAIQFSAGASGYPWTWAHLSDDEKAAISRRACAGKLELIREAARLYGASTVLPFASHFTLWHPEHRQYARLMTRNSLEDVKRALASTDIDVVDLLPGERWDVGAGTIARVYDDRTAPFAPACVSAYMDSAVDSATFAASHPADASLTQAELVAYLDRLNAVPEIVHCEDLTVRIRAAASPGDTRSLDVAFAVSGGRLQMLSEAPERPNLSIDVPLAVLTTVVRDGLSWDEAFIGYWCHFDRHPNVYHAGFWRLLQAPYFGRRVDESTSTHATIDRASTVAELLESHGATADRILRRYGLYCSGCHHSTSESLDAAARVHGIDTHRVDQLIRELTRVCATEGV
jgi:CMP-N-acetylneuraminate monooxygenase